MNLRILITMVVLVLFPVPGFSAKASHSETVIQYGQFNGHPIQLVYEPQTRTLILRVIAPDAPDGIPKADDPNLVFLKREAERLGLAKKPIQLGKTPYHFVYGDGYLLWIPYQMSDGGDKFVCLMFADAATVVGHNIKGNGAKEIPPDWGYDKESP